MGSEEGHAVLAGLRSDLHVSAETSRRIACDAGRVDMVHGSGGEILSVGRRRRTVPAAIRRALETRDRGCRFPGCGSRYCDAHHVKHWADGGKTRLGNLVLLCRKHHRAVHEDGFSVEVVEGATGSGGGESSKGDTGGAVRFRWPDGRLLPEAPELPPPPSDPVMAVRLQHEAEAYHIDPWTPTPHAHPCDQGRMDLDWTMMVLLGREEKRRERQREKARERQREATRGT